MPDGVRPPLVRALVQLGLVVLVLVAVGALAGAVWEWVWTAPVGVVVDHKWVAADESNLRGQFSGTGWFVIVGAVAGLVAGALVALFLDQVPIATLVGVVVGSLLGVAVMYRVGVTLGPSDPVRAASSAREGAHLPAQLAVSGGSAWIAFPAGALVALSLVFLGLSAVHRDTERPEVA